MARKKSKKVPRDDDVIYEVEQIIGHRRSSSVENMIEYHINWKGYPKEFNTWEVQNNLYCPELVDEYWVNHLETLRQSRKRAQSPPASSSSSSSPPQQAITVEYDQFTCDIEEESPEISVEPPTGLEWSDIQAIVNVRRDNANTYIAEVEWLGETENTRISTSIIKLYNPLQLIWFYESVIEFR